MGCNTSLLLNSTLRNTLQIFLSKHRSNIREAEDKVFFGQHQLMTTRTLSSAVNYLIKM
jgi:hypothetical protein